MDLHADLDQVLLGGRERREIVIVDYDPEWGDMNEYAAAKGPFIEGLLAVAGTFFPLTKLPEWA